MSEIEDPFRTVLEIIEQPTNPHSFAQYPKHERPIHISEDMGGDTVKLLSDRTDKFGDVAVLMEYDGPMMEREDLR